MLGLGTKHAESGPEVVPSDESRAEVEKRMNLFCVINKHT